MAQQFDVGKAPIISVSTCDELVIKGWDQPQVVVKSGSARVTEVESGLVIACSGPLRLVVPEQAQLKLDQVHGDLVIKNVLGLIEIDAVSGDAILVGIGAANLGKISGDLSAKHIGEQLVAGDISGDAAFRQVEQLKLGTIHGDFAARVVNGSVAVGDVMGDIALRSVAGDVAVGSGHRDANFRFLNGQTSVGQIHGDIRIYGELAAGSHVFSANGDVVLRWPVNTAVSLTATGSKIVNQLKLDHVVETDRSLTGQIGSSGPAVTLNAGGRVVLKDLYVVGEEWEQVQADDTDFDFTIDLEGLGAEISARMSQHVARLSSELESRFGPDFAQALSEKITRKAEQAAARAEQAAERARQRAEQKLRQSRAHRPAPPPPPKQPASPEEQLKILKMVEQGTISPEEASMLLEALERKG